MIKYNFIRVITFISILVFFFAQSVYDPSVHAKMQRMEDESLSEVNATALNIDLNLTVRSVVTDLFRLKDAQSPYDSINFSAVEICNGTQGTGARINAIMSWDIGAQSTGAFIGKTWLIGTNIIFPYNNSGLAVIANNPYFYNDNATYLPLGNSMIISGISFGQNVNATPNLRPIWMDGTNANITSPWVILTSEGTAVRGLEFYMEIAGYIDNIKYYWNNNKNAAGSIDVSGVYIYGMMNDAARTPDDANWNNVNRSGATKMGGSYPIYDVTTGAVTSNTTTLYESIDIGTGTGAGGNVNTRVTLNLPTAGSIRIRDFQFGGRDWGAIDISELVFYNNRFTFKDLKKL